MVLRAARIEPAALALLLELDEGHRHVMLGAHGGQRVRAAGGGSARRSGRGASCNEATSASEVL